MSVNGDELPGSTNGDIAESKAKKTSASALMDEAADEFSTTTKVFTSKESDLFPSSALDKSSDLSSLKSDFTSSLTSRRRKPLNLEDDDLDTEKVF